MFQTTIQPALLDLRERLKGASNLADKAWVIYLKKNGKTAINVRCGNCFSQWCKNGRNIVELPPVFPPDHEGKECPMCGSRLPKASFKF